MVMGCFLMHSGASLAVAILLLLLLGCQAAASDTSSRSALQQQQHQIRKLLNNSGVGGGGYSTAKQAAPDGCSQDEVAVYQNNAPELSSGIPAYSVEIINVGTCTVHDVHVSCSDFASTDLINPAVFRRLGFNNCLVKDGGAMEPGETVSFQYSNSFAYPLDIASLVCN